MNDKIYKELDDCCEILHIYCVKYGRMGGQIKEKYETLRFYVCFNELSLHTIMHPNYYYYQFKGLMVIIDNIITFLLKPFNPIFYNYQKFLYKFAYLKCLKKYPHLKYAILSCADYPELIGIDLD